MKFFSQFRMNYYSSTFFLVKYLSLLSEWQYLYAVLLENLTRGLKPQPTKSPIKYCKLLEQSVTNGMPLKQNQSLDLSRCPNDPYFTASFTLPELNVALKQIDPNEALCLNNVHLRNTAQKG